VESCRPGEPISYEEYLRTDWTDHANNPELRYKYVICSQEEARIILENGYLAVPLVILPVFSKDFPIRDIDDYLDFLATKPRIDVHIYDSLQKEEGEDATEKEGKSKSRNGKNEAGKNFLLPEPMLSADAISLFRSGEKGPVNFLNLDLWEDNAIPQCMVGLRDWSILRDTRDENQSGKRSYRQPDDLSSCTGFEVCASEYAWSMPHRDRHGTTTSVRVRNKGGKKYWIEWPRLTREEELAWAEEGGQVPPGVAPMGLFLFAGVTMLQPGGIVHAPYTMTKVHMTGGVYWYAGALDGPVQQTLDEIRWPHMTNEYPAKEIGIKLGIIEALITKGEQYYNFGPPSMQAKVLDLIKVRPTPLLHPEDT
jgi:hypothetical protein